MQPFTDDDGTKPFIPPLSVEESESESTSERLLVPTGAPYSFVPPPFMLRPYEHDQPVIPDEADYESFDDEPSLCYILKMYRFRPRRGDWKHISSRGSSNADDDPMVKPLPSSMRIITWNVDIIENVWQDWINKILRHLQEIIDSHDKRGGSERHRGDAVVVLLQEITPMMFNLIRTDEWVRRTFAIVPLREDKWPRQACCGNVTLVSRDLEVVKAQIVHFRTTDAQRTGLLVYVQLSATGKIEDKRTICIANTHLESFPSGERKRARQLETLAQLLKLDDNIEGGLIAGNMNPVGKMDCVLACNLGLDDAWQRGDFDPEGFTWGYQSSDEDKKYPPARLDKILYVPKRRYSVDEPQRIGVGLKVVVTEQEQYWVSGHYGLLTSLHMDSSLKITNLVYD